MSEWQCRNKLLPLAIVSAWERQKLKVAMPVPIPLLVSLLLLSTVLDMMAEIEHLQKGGGQSTLRFIYMRPDDLPVA